MEGRGELTQDQQAGKGGSCYVLCCRVTGQTHPQDQGSCYRLEQWRSHPSFIKVSKSGSGLQPSVAADSHTHIHHTRLLECLT